jgi:hypothetical protein
MVQAFVVGRDIGLQVNMPGAHSCRPECVPESMPGKEPIG